jgi:hypothetical protein
LLWANLDLLTIGVLKRIALAVGVLSVVWLATLWALS